MHPVCVIWTIWVAETDAAEDCKSDVHGILLLRLSMPFQPVAIISSTQLHMRAIQLTLYCRATRRLAADSMSDGLTGQDRAL